ncbi:DEAD/DEAH box helicase family protein [uncultured Pseudonocardia sp.]|uniref:DEAD/DEAH box helicase family protein n=1 Tax=uncultured Pseudonocardia sp. TaxID=211455 RepID=UPI002638EB0B|nr:DEAD/DEAH box helicase family protein [uncultured Pseudonocardia sp.]
MTPTTPDHDPDHETETGLDRGGATRIPHRLQRHALHHLHAHPGDRGVVVMPCGSGKTLLGRWLAEQTSAALTVVFVPSLALVGQTVLAYRAGATWPHHTMIVYSDPTSGRAVAVDDLDLPAWARDAVTASTSRPAISTFLGGAHPRSAGRGGRARLIVSAYHSEPRVAAALVHAGTVADLVICDEAHRLTGRPRREFRAVLDPDTLPARRRVFLTATPVEAAAWGVEQFYDELYTKRSNAPFRLGLRTSTYLANERGARATSQLQRQRPQAVDSGRTTSCRCGPFAAQLAGPGGRNHRHRDRGRDPGPIGRQPSSAQASARASEPQHPQSGGPAIIDRGPDQGRRRDPRSETTQEDSMLELSSQR